MRQEDISNWKNLESAYLYGTCILLAFPAESALAEQALPYQTRKTAIGTRQIQVLEQLLKSDFACSS